MHWVLIYFLVQPVDKMGGAGGVGQIRFRTKPACERFLSELKAESERVEVSHAKFGRYAGKEKAHTFSVDGVCMMWSAT